MTTTFLYRNDEFWHLPQITYGQWTKLTKSNVDRGAFFFHNLRMLERVVYKPSSSITNLRELVVVQSQPTRVSSRPITNIRELK